MSVNVNHVQKEASAAQKAVLVLDEGLDFYIQYNAAKRRIANENARKSQMATLKAPPVKTAGLFCKSVEAKPRAYGLPVEKTSSFWNVVKALRPSPITGAFMASGLLASAYGPESMGGPAEGEEQLSPKRALRTGMLYTVVGRSAYGASENIKRGITSMKSDQLLQGGAALGKVAPAAAVSGIVLKRIVERNPVSRDDLYRASRLGSKASIVSAFPSMLVDQIGSVMDHAAQGAHAYAVAKERL